jgi:hypothetical protein
MGKKYLVDVLLADAIHRLTSEYPSSLNKFLTPGGKHISLTSHRELDVILVAAEVGLLSVLPAAFYECSLPMSQIFSGVQRDDGTLTTIPKEIQHRLLTGRDTLSRERHQTVCAWQEACDKVCSDKRPGRTCLLARRNILVTELKHEPENMNYFTQWSSAWGQELCNSCRSHGESTHNASRADLWEKLPEKYGLPSWETLRTSSLS